MDTSCDCPYPGVGCKHTVAALLDIAQNIRYADPSAAGSADVRRRTYKTDDSLFKITNYEAVLRDVGPIYRFRPDLVILDDFLRDYQ